MGDDPKTAEEMRIELMAALYSAAVPHRKLTERRAKISSQIMEAENPDNIARSLLFMASGIHTLAQVRAAIAMLNVMDGKR